MNISEKYYLLLFLINSPLMKLMACNGYTKFLSIFPPQMFQVNRNNNNYVHTNT